MLTDVFLHEIWATIEYGVRSVVTKVQKEWLSLPRTLFNEVDGFDIQPVGEVFVFAKPVICKIDPGNRLIAKDIRPEIRTVADAFYFTANVPVESVIPRLHFVLRPVMGISGEVPLADYSSDVTVTFENLW